MSKFVYVVSMGEKHEGGHVAGIFKSYVSARAEVAEHLEVSKRPFEPVDAVYYGSRCINAWEYGCDFITIEKIRLND